MCRPNGSIMNFSSVQPERYVLSYIRLPAADVAPDLVMGIARTGADAQLFVRRDVERRTVGATRHQAVLDFSLIAQGGRQVIAGDDDQQRNNQSGQRRAPADAAVLVVSVVRHAAAHCRANTVAARARCLFPRTARPG